MLNRTDPETRFGPKNRGQDVSKMGMAINTFLVGSLMAFFKWYAICNPKGFCESDTRKQLAVRHSRKEISLISVSFRILSLL